MAICSVPEWLGSAGEGSGGPSWLVTKRPRDSLESTG